MFHHLAAAISLYTYERHEENSYSVLCNGHLHVGANFQRYCIIFLWLQPTRHKSLSSFPAQFSSAYILQHRPNN
jgi:hypothetical protein